MGEAGSVTTVFETSLHVATLVFQAVFNWAMDEYLVCSSRANSALAGVTLVPIRVYLRSFAVVLNKYDSVNMIL